jgi:hypothetical protein
MSFLFEHEVSYILQKRNRNFHLDKGWLLFVYPKEQTVRVEKTEEPDDDFFISPDEASKHKDSYHYWIHNL